MNGSTTTNEAIVQEISRRVISALKGAEFAEITATLKVKDGVVTFAEVGRVDQFKPAELVGGTAYVHRR